MSRSNETFVSGKRRGKHSFCLPAGYLFACEVDKYPEVTGIAPGEIENHGRTSSYSKKIVRIVKKKGHVLVVVRQNASEQRFLVYTNNSQTTMLSAARWVRNEGFELTFKDNRVS